ncbi:hypothetical protein BH20ACT23_BH20ACT23_23530 [soil metagenome]
MSGHRKVRPGVVLSVVGPDGVGKSTLIDSLVEDGLKDHQIMRIRNVGMLPRRTVPGEPVTEPHKDPPYSTVLSFAKLAYVFVDYLAGWFLRLRPFVRKGGWVVLERGWWDMAVDPTRYRLKIPVRLMFGLGRLLPKPDVLFVLEAPTAVVFERKQELSLEELERQMRVWRDLLPSEQKRVFLNAALPAGEVLAAAQRSIEHLRTAAEHVAPVNLPRAGNARWVLPRTPRAAAKNGLHIYHPVTLRGLVGWHVARAGATMGLFALLPKGRPPTSTVEEMLTTYVPEGGTMAVARTNHAGRYVALVLDPAGRSVAVAKIASDDRGRSKLQNEACRIDQFSDCLSSPLSGPRVIAREDGLLLMEAIPWESRSRPWRLPGEVASSLGRFFVGGNGQPAGGLTHGDFAPWNLLRTKSGWVLLDWEEARTSGEPFWDVFHFLVQGNALLRRPTRRALLSGLDGRGWVGDSIRAYALSAGLAVEAAPEWFRSYLEVSQGDLKAETHDGRAGLRARRALLGDLRG